MSDPRRFKDISVDDLLAYVTDAKLDLTDVKFDSNNTVLSFIEQFGCHPGDDLINATLLYKLYKNAVKEPLARESFHHILKTYLTLKDGYYHVDNKQHKISILALNMLHEDRATRSLKPRQFKKFNQFLEKYNISAGKEWFTLDFIYQLYIVYNRQIKGRKISRTNFQYLLTKTFKTKYDGNRYYAVTLFIENVTSKERRALIKLLNHEGDKTQNTQRRKEVRWLKQIS
jgi:hypothetical protein